MYQGDGRYRRISVKDGVRDARPRKGIWEHMLCRDCEGRTGVYDQYAGLFARGDGLTSTRMGENEWLIEGVNYPRLKLFAMALLMRAAASSDAFFTKVHLGPNYEDLRLRVLNGEPGACHEYRTFIHPIYDSACQLDVDQFIVEPDDMKLFWQRHYRFVFGGYMWFVSPTPKYQPSLLRSACLQEGGRVRFNRVDLRDFEGFKRFQVSFAKKMMKGELPMRKRRPST